MINDVLGMYHWVWWECRGQVTQTRVWGECGGRLGREEVM